MSLRIQGVTGSIEGRTLFEEVSLTVERGERAWVVGPSGAGKSSLLRMVAHLEPFSGGEVTLRDRTPEAWGVPEFRRRVHLVPQDAGLFGPTVRAALERPRRFRSHAPWSEERLLHGLFHLGLTEAQLAQDPTSLSGGERQRFAILRGLMLRPDVLVLDEPTSALDADSAERAWSYLDGLRATEGLGMLVGAHASTGAGNVTALGRDAARRRGAAS